MSTTTLSPISASEGGLFVRLFYWLVRRRLGRVPTPLRVTAHNKRVLVAYGLFESTADVGSLLEPRHKALANLKAAMEVGCRFCVDIGSRVAADAGLSRAELEALVDPVDHPLFDALDQDVLALTVSMTQTPALIDKTLVLRLERVLGPKALVELTSVIAWENYRARFNHTFGAKEEGFSDMVCILPSLPPQTDELTGPTFFAEESF